MLKSRLERLTALLADDSQWEGDEWKGLMYIDYEGKKFCFVRIVITTPEDEALAVDADGSVYTMKCVDSNVNLVTITS